jgi:hypothetical protein
MMSQPINALSACARNRTRVPARRGRICLLSDADDELRSAADQQAADPVAVHRYPAKAFDDRTGTVRAVMRPLADRHDRIALYRIGFRVYDMFRRMFPPENEGWPANSVLEVDKILEAIRQTPGGSASTDHNRRAPQVPLYAGLIPRRKFFRPWGQSNASNRRIDGDRRVRNRRYTDTLRRAVQNIALSGCGHTNANGHRFRTEVPPIPRTFAYVRVSSTGQTTENQIQEIEAAGFKVDRRRVVSETVSGSSAIEGCRASSSC